MYCNRLWKSLITKIMNIMKHCVLYLCLVRSALVRFRSEGSSVELCGPSSGSVSLGRTPRAAPPHVASAPPPSPSEKQHDQSQNTENRWSLNLQFDHGNEIPPTYQLLQVSKHAKQNYIKDRECTVHSCSFIMIKQ